MQAIRHQLASALLDQQDSDGFGALLQCDAARARSLFEPAAQALAGHTSRSIFAPHTVQSWRQRALRCRMRRLDGCCLRGQDSVMALRGAPLQHPGTHWI